MNRYFFVIILLFIASTTVVLADNSLTRTLKLGDRGEDVRLLQQMLNKDPETVVATSGLGALGNESTYFGLRTREAVIKFQEKYASSTLSPLGLTKGTGNFGKLTLNFLAEMFGLSTSSPLVNNLNTSAIPNIVNLITDVAQQFSPAPLPPAIVGVGNSVNVNKPAVPGLLVGLDNNGIALPTGVSAISLTDIAPKEGVAGTVVTIYGNGFATSTPTKIYIGGQAKQVMSNDGKTLVINVSAPVFGVSDNNVATSVQSISGAAFNEYSHKGYSVNGAQITIIGGRISYSAIKPNGRSVSGTLGNLSLQSGSGISLPIGIYAVDAKGNPSNGLTFKMRY